MNRWLFKSEPNTYSIKHLEADGMTSWEGIRNYQARNFIRDDMRVNDKILFYHSSCKIPGVVGLARISRKAYPDPTSWDKASPYFDERSSPDNPRWFMVNIQWQETFAIPVTLQQMRTDKALTTMWVLKPGQRLSIQPVEPAHFERIVAIGRNWK